MQRLRFMTCLFAAGFIAACGSGDQDDADGASAATMTKDDARQAGKADQDTDFCADYGWYGDTVCDNFCLQPDPDCEDSTCGGIANIPCGVGQYCKLEACTMADSTGTCELLPEACAAVIDPVCGCDNHTYNNACAAARAGVTVLHTGECEASDDDCGGIAGLGCGDGEYCKVDTCLVPDASGTCTVVPDACPAVIDPVCGCDGQTYDNACSAARYGVSVRGIGACPDCREDGCLTGESCLSCFGQYICLPYGTTC